MRTSTLGLALLAALSSPVIAGPQQQTTDPGPSADRVAALEARIAALESELQQIRAELAATGTPATAAAPQAQAPVDDLEALAAEPRDSAAEASLAAPVAAASAGGSNPNAFNPAITLILNGRVSTHSLDPAAYARSGFPLVGEGGPGAKGLSLGESELAFAANIDDKFFGQLTLAVESEDGQDEIGVEEAFIDTTSLPGGLNVRAGRFYSDIGYLNSHHPHTDNFSDRPLPYQAFLGGQYGDDGVRVRWVAPTALFFEAGAEVFRGNAFPAAGAGNGGFGTRTLFAHVGGDAGRDHEWLAGASMLKARSNGAEDGFSGDATLYVLDGTWKWAPQGNFKDAGLTLRGEYFIDDRNGSYTDPADDSVVLPWDGKRRGAYLEAVYRLSRSWDIGYRYDRLWADGDAFAGLPIGSGFDPFRHTAEITWRNSEFSLLRLQVGRDQPNGEATDNSVTLQYQTSLGAHGAHKF